jgi:hypothetical protein
MVNLDTLVGAIVGAIIGAVVAGIFSIIAALAGACVGYYFSLKAAIHDRKLDALQNLYSFALKLKNAANDSKFEAVFRNAKEVFYNKIYSNMLYYKEAKDIQKYLADFEDVYSQGVSPSVYYMSLHNGEDLCRMVEKFYDLVEEKVGNFK